MTHRNAPLSVEGRRRAVEETVHGGRPIAHVAAEFHIARSTLSKWVARYRDQGVEGLEDRSSAPRTTPFTATGLGHRTDRAVAPQEEVAGPTDHP